MPKSHFTVTVKKRYNYFNVIFYCSSSRAKSESLKPSEKDSGCPSSSACAKMFVTILLRTSERSPSMQLSIVCRFFKPRNSPIWGSTLEMLLAKARCDFTSSLPVALSVSRLFNNKDLDLVRTFSRSSIASQASDLTSSETTWSLVFFLFSFSQFFLIFLQFFVLIFLVQQKVHCIVALVLLLFDHDLFFSDNFFNIFNCAWEGINGGKSFFQILWLFFNKE